MMILKLNNKGAAIVSVLVITAFITVIGTVILYISGQNYQEKQTDYQNKQSFYGAEEALDMLKAALVSDVEEAYKSAYSETIQNYIRLGTKDAREQFYNKKYLDKLTSIWKDRKGSEDGKWLDAVKSCIQEYTEGNKNYSDTEELSLRIYNVDSVGTATGSDNGQVFVLKGVVAKYTLGIYTTFIYTDICIEIPPYTSTIRDETVTSTEDSTSGDESITSTEDREIIDLTDYVIYMNWRRADYSEFTEAETEVVE
jgi:hypothetical protein